MVCFALLKWFDLDNLQRTSDGNPGKSDATSLIGACDVIGKFMQKIYISGRVKVKLSVRQTSAIF